MRQLMHSFTGFSAPPDILDAVRRGQISSFCLFGSLNVTSPAQLRELTDNLRAAASEGGMLPPLIGIDQEGGQLIAITNGATELPGNMALGATRSPRLAEKAGYVLGSELLGMGVNLDFAPSVDINVNPANPVIGTRSFGSDPALVASLGNALIRGLQSAGAIATAKHFPGHGDTATDSHFGLPIVEHAMERMRAVELLPFREAIQAGVDCMMSAHIVFSVLDPNRPATLSPIVLKRFLRQELGFTGLILSDAMDMYAVAQYGAENSVRAALRAGVDVALLAHLPDQLSLNSLLDDAEDRGAIMRIEAVQRRIPRDLPSLDLVGCAEHQLIAQEIADASITLVRDTNRLPLRPSPDDTLAVITCVPQNLTPADTSSDVKIKLADVVRQRHLRTQAFELPADASDTQVASILEQVSQTSTVIVGTINALPDSGQAALIHALYARGQSPIVLAMRMPSELVTFPQVETCLCTYSIRPVSMEAAARVLFGEITARGVLPLAGYEPMQR